MSRTLAIGDIHGCLKSLEAMEAYVAFTGDDRIILLGDYVDRGPDTRGILDWLIDACGRLHLVCLRGNHDIVMLDARKGEAELHAWLEFGGDAALNSYGDEDHDASLVEIPAAHWEFLEDQLLPYFETDNQLFTHATPVPHLPLSAQSPHDLYWRKFGEWAGPHRSGKTLVCGHTSQKNGQPALAAGAICIDTWACGDGWLMCLDVETGEYWQTSERGGRQHLVLTMPTS